MHFSGKERRLGKTFFWLQAGGLIDLYHYLKKDKQDMVRQAKTISRCRPYKNEYKKNK